MTASLADPKVRHAFYLDNIERITKAALQALTLDDAKEGLRLIQEGIDLARTREGE